MSQVYIDFVKPLDIDVIKVNLLETMDNYRNQQYIFNEIKPVLEDFAGKKVTQRLITKLKEKFPLFRCYLRWVGTAQCYLEVSWADVNHNNKGELSLFLGHIGAFSWAQGDNGKGFYTMDMLANNNVWLYNIDVMLKSMLDGLKHIDTAIKEWNIEIEKLQAIHKRMDRYEGLGTYFKFTN